MIGQLINKFDLLEDPTLKDFNEMFTMRLEGDSKASVIIGTMTIGGLREVLIGGNMKLIEIIKRREYNKKVQKIRDNSNHSGSVSRFLYTAEKDGVVKEFGTMKKMADFLERVPSALSGRFNKKWYSKEVDGWTISRKLKEKN